jgi:Trypsin-co-occurring domain 1
MTDVVAYAVDDRTVVQVEIAQGVGAQLGAPGWIIDAASPAFAAAAVLLEQARETSADKVEIRFGLKATGGVNWMIAFSPADANFEVTLTWDPAAAAQAPAPTEQSPAPSAATP